MGIARIGGPLLRARSVVRLDHYIQIRLFSKMSEDWSSNKRRPSALDVPVFLFLPEQVFPQSEDVADDRGWRSLCSDLRIVPAAGDHFTMLGSKHIDDLITNIVEATNSVK
jgi:thioesterase domain-containing protein